MPTKAPLHIDFDKRWADEAAKIPPPRVKVRGETIELPRSMPAKVLLLQAEFESDDRLTIELVRDVLAILVGAERVDRWIEDDVTVEQLFDIARTIGDLVNDAGKPAKAEDEQP